MLGVAEARRRLAQQRSARSARPAALRGDGGRSSSPARPTWQRRQPDSAADTAQDTTMVELQDTHEGSSCGGQETKLRRIRRTGVYALMDERILRSRVTRL